MNELMDSEYYSLYLFFKLLMPHYIVILFRVTEVLSVYLHVIHPSLILVVALNDLSTPSSA